MIIAIPSKSRAGRTTSQKVLPNGIFYVPESEVHQYKPFVKNVIGVPKEVKGITPTRNWILKNTKEKYVVFIDDDVKTCGYTKLEKRKSRKIEIRSEQFWNVEFEKFFMLCEELNYKMWGVRTEASPRGCYPYKPILFRTYLTASCMGLINDGEYYFDESYTVKEDYEICLRHIKDKGGILGIRYLHWENEHWGTEGGCKDYRTIDIERECIKKLIKQYPKMIKNAKRKNNEFCIKLNL
tara:strand:- start:1547 stop:2263 length:717 start_codon:yes stop_codon:yes gene_type:complete